MAHHSLDGAQDRPFDLLIRGGAVIDGTGSPTFPANVGIRGDRVAAIGRLNGEAKRVIDAKGLTVAPGFIDVHSHDDAAVLSTPMDFKLMQGVTTDIVGNCGAGVAPADEAFDGYFKAGISNVLGPIPERRWESFGEYMDAVEESHPAVNVACLVPHGVVRFRVLRLDGRPPEPGELAAMRELVAEAMAAGAVGLSTGLIYPPGAFARTEELVELAREAAAAGGLYASHIRNEGKRLLEAVGEAARIGREAGLPVQISHHKAAGKENWGGTERSIRFIDEARKDGQDITWDVYPYTAASTILSALAGSPETADPEAVMIASVRAKTEYEGRNIAQIAEMLDLPPEQAIDRVLADEPSAVAIFFTMEEGDVRRVMDHDCSMIGSDGIPSPTGKPHPRLYGTFARVLGRYAREEGVLTLENAVRKMTGLPARRFKLEKRGELRDGWFADLVVFDAQRITDRATYEDPRQYPDGIDYVIVNGEVAAESGRQTASRAGRVLRRGDGS
jgi:N-acyl-D-amino-acid deacylase